jgi:hypothetical protein
MPEEKGQFSTPMPPGVRSRSAFRVGAVRTGSVKLTPSEKEALEASGWKEGDPIPTNFAEVLASAQTPAVDEVVLPGSDAPTAEQDVGRQALEDAKELLAQAKQREKLALSGADESVQKAMGVAAGVTAPDENIVVDDTEDETYDTGQEKSETGAMAPMQFCPHCSRDLKQKSLEPSDTDKQKFLQALLGQIPFQKVYRLMDGKLSVTLRSLTPLELDSCFDQAYEDRKDGKLEAPDAYFEQINRYRVALQLVRIQAGEIVHVFPADTGKWMKKFEDEDPNCLSTPEKTEEGEEGAPRKPVGTIADYVFSYVIKTESLNRIIGGLMGEFNSLLIKLEANAHSSDFWSTTRSPT